MQPINNNYSISLLNISILIYEFPDKIKNRKLYIICLSIMWIWDYLGIHVIIFTVLIET